MSFLEDVGSAIGSAAKVAISPIATVANAAVNAAESTFGIAKDVISTVTSNPLVNIVSQGVSEIPGIGSIAGAGMGALHAIGQGASLADIGLAAAKGALPGQPLSGVAFDIACGALLKGQGLDEISLSTLRNNMPGGDAGKMGFDVALAAMQGRAEVANNPVVKAAYDKLPIDSAIRGAFMNGVGGSASIEAIKKAAAEAEEKKRAKLRARAKSLALRGKAQAAQAVRKKIKSQDDVVKEAVNYFQTSKRPTNLVAAKAQNALAFKAFGTALVIQKSRPNDIAQSTIDYLKGKGKELKALVLQFTADEKLKQSQLAVKQAERLKALAGKTANDAAAYKAGVLAANARNISGPVAKAMANDLKNVDPVVAAGLASATVTAANAQKIVDKKVNATVHLVKSADFQTRLERRDKATTRRYMQIMTLAHQGNKLAKGAMAVIEVAKKAKKNDPKKLETARVAVKNVLAKAKVKAKVKVSGDSTFISGFDIDNESKTAIAAIGAWLSTPDPSTFQSRSWQAFRSHNRPTLGGFFLRREYA